MAEVLKKQTDDQTDRKLMVSIASADGYTGAIYFNSFRNLHASDRRSGAGADGDVPALMWTERPVAYAPAVNDISRGPGGTAILVALMRGSASV